MNEIASPGQLRMSFVRWALVTVPLIVILGSFMGYISNSGYDNDWFARLAKPDLTPPGWVFGVVWPVLYLMLGLAIAMILNARRAAGRGLAIALFVAQLVANLLWSPLFFGMHQVSAALLWLAAIFLLAAGTTYLFARIRPAAAWLMAPYLAWLCFALLLNFQVDRLNPDAETLVVGATSTQI